LDQDRRFSSIDLLDNVFCASTLGRKADLCNVSLKSECRDSDETQNQEQQNCGGDSFHGFHRQYEESMVVMMTTKLISQNMSKKSGIFLREW
jgi:hypothetical protein